MASPIRTNKLRLNKSRVDALPVPAKGEKPVIYWDDKLAGFYVQISDRGTCTFYAYGRLPNGRQSRVKIGRHGVVAAEKAREEAKKVLGRIAGGDDPAADKRQARQDEKERRAAATVADLCDRYLAEHVDLHNKPRTQAENRRMVEKIIKPALGRMKVAAVDYEDVARLHGELKKTPRQANHVVAILSKMFNLAERWKDNSGKQALRPLNSNPCRHIKRYDETERDRYLMTEELERVGATLRELEDEGAIRPAIAAAVRFLALTGCRLNEAVGLTWGAINAKTGVWSIPDDKAKTGARTIMLGAPALVLLASLDRTCERVFGALTTGQVEKAWAGDHPHADSRKRARPGIRDRAGIADVRLHDLRHTTGTYAGAAGLNAFLVRDLLGHKTMAMTGRYVSKHVDPLRAAADAISGQIAAAMERPPAEVVDLPKAAGQR